MQESQVKAAPLSPAAQREWWGQLNDVWKQAFNETVFQQYGAGDPTNEQLESLWSMPVLRMAGPGAMFPNMSVTLEDLSGLSRLVNLEILVVINHQIRSLRPLGNLSNLHSLFVFSNEIESLEGLERLTKLQKFFFNDNRVTSLAPLSGLTNLDTIHCAHNKITSLEGIGAGHKALKEFYCLPNDGLWQSEISRFENEFRIRCLKG